MFHKEKSISSAHYCANINNSMVYSRFLRPHTHQRSIISEYKFMFYWNLDSLTNFIRSAVLQCTAITQCCTAITHVNKLNQLIATHDNLIKFDN